MSDSIRNRQRKGDKNAAETEPVERHFWFDCLAFDGVCRWIFTWLSRSLECVFITELNRIRIATLLSNNHNTNIRITIDHNAQGARRTV